MSPFSLDLREPRSSGLESNQRPPRVRVSLANTLQIASSGSKPHLSSCNSFFVWSVDPIPRCALIWGRWPVCLRGLIRGTERGPCWLVGRHFR